ncbi:MAG: hypothetical protein Q9201_002563, partial [Fulgogasparrea decipioides]
ASSSLLQLLSPSVKNHVYLNEQSMMSALSKTDSMALNEEEITRTNAFDQPNMSEHTDPKRLFDALATSYSNAYVSNNAQRRCVQKLISMLSAGSRILDIGSGTGSPTASMLTDAEMIVTGIDISSAMVDAARANVPRATFHVGDMRRYQPANGQKFDAIVSIFSMINLPTNALREMAFKMAHWLKPGGLLVLGIVDFAGVVKADEYPDDPYNEWLNHRFMGRVIKDNVFGVGQWISLLRSADIALVDAQGTVFTAEDSGIVMEPECFFIGRKGEKNALIGPYPPPYQADGLRQHYTLGGIEKHVICNNAFLETLLGYSRAVRCLSSYEIQAATMSSATLEGQGSYATVMATDLLCGPNDMRELLSQLSSLHNSDATESTIILVAPAPFNDTMHILNEVASFFNFPQIHHGVLLGEAVIVLRQLGFTYFETHLVGDEYMGFSSSADKSRVAATLLKSAFVARGVHRDAIEAALGAQVERYFESQKHLGGHSQRIGFQRIALQASKSQVRITTDVKDLSRT